MLKIKSLIAKIRAVGGDRPFLLAVLLSGLLLSPLSVAEPKEVRAYDDPFSLAGGEWMVAQVTDDSSESDESGDEDENGDSDNSGGFLQDFRDSDERTGFSFNFSSGVILGDPSACDDAFAYYENRGENGYSLTCGWGGVSLGVGASYHLNRYAAVTAGWIYSFDSYSIEPDYGVNGSIQQDFSTIPVGAVLTLPLGSGGFWGVPFEIGYHWWKRTGYGVLQFHETGNYYYFNDASGEDIYYGLGLQYGDEDSIVSFKWRRMNGDDPDHVSDPTVDLLDFTWAVTF